MSESERIAGVSHTPADPAAPATVTREQREQQVRIRFARYFTPEFCAELSSHLGAAFAEAAREAQEVLSGELSTESKR